MSVQAAEPGANGRIVFDHAGDIFRINADGTGRTNLTSSSNIQFGARWSRDGSKIAYINGGSLWVMNADGTGQRQVARYAASHAPAWSPDGNQIAFTDYANWPDNNSRQIYVVNLDGSGLRQLTSHGAPNYAPDWGDNGYIAFTSARHGNEDIFFTDAARGGEWAAVAETANDRAADWHGNMLAFSTNRDGNYEVYKVDVFAGTTQRLTNTPTAHEHGPVLSPDGKKLAFSRTTTGVSEVYVMDIAGGAVTNLGSGHGPDWLSAPVVTNGESRTLQPPPTCRYCY